jgi:hypothetical protein
MRRKRAGKTTVKGKSKPKREAKPSTEPDAEPKADGPPLLLLWGSGFACAAAVRRQLDLDLRGTRGEGVGSFR